MNARTLDAVVTLPGHDDTTRIAVLRDCAVVLTTANPGLVRIWNLDGGDIRWQGTTRNVAPDVAVDERCGRVAVADLDRVKVIGLADGREIATLRGHDAQILSARFLHGGRTLLTTDDSGLMRRWPLPTATSEVETRAMLPRQLTDDQERMFGLQ